MLWVSLHVLYVDVCVCVCVFEFMHLCMGLVWMCDKQINEYGIQLYADLQLNDLGNSKTSAKNSLLTVAPVTFAMESAGMSHTVLLQSDGKAVACGQNADGQCNIPPLDERLPYTQVSASMSHTVLLRSDGSAVACGIQDTFGPRNLIHPGLRKCTPYSTSPKRWLCCGLWKQPPWTLRHPTFGWRNVICAGFCSWRSYSTASEWWHLCLLWHSWCWSMWHTNFTWWTHDIRPDICRRVSFGVSPEWWSCCGLRIQLQRRMRHPSAEWSSFNFFLRAHGQSAVA